MTLIVEEFTEAYLELHELKSKVSPEAWETIEPVVRRFGHLLMPITNIIGTFEVAMESDSHVE